MVPRKLADRSVTRVFSRSFLPYWRDFRGSRKMCVTVLTPLVSEFFFVARFGSLFSDKICRKFLVCSKNWRRAFFPLFDPLPTSVSGSLLGAFSRLLCGFSGGQFLGRFSRRRHSFFWGAAGALGHQNSPPATPANRGHRHICSNG